MNARLVRVVDGDTVVVRRFGLLGFYEESIRLAGIDAPERNQPGGTEATEALRNFLNRSIPRGVVYLTTRGYDRYGRTIGDIAIKTYCSTILNPYRLCIVDSARFMVRNGYAWAVADYGASRRLLSLWSLARQRRRGIWRLPNPLLPSIWRRRRRRRRRKFSSQNNTKNTHLDVKLLVKNIQTIF